MKFAVRSFTRALPRVIMPLVRLHPISELEMSTGAIVGFPVEAHRLTSTKAKMVMLATTSLAAQSAGPLLSQTYVVVMTVKKAGRQTEEINRIIVAKRSCMSCDRSSQSGTCVIEVLMAARLREVLPILQHSRG